MRKPSSQACFPRCCTCSCCGLWEWRALAALSGRPAAHDNRTSERAWPRLCRSQEPPPPPPPLPKPRSRTAREPTSSTGLTSRQESSYVGTFVGQPVESSYVGTLDVPKHLGTSTYQRSPRVALQNNRTQLKPVEVGFLRHRKFVRWHARRTNLVAGTYQVV